jgi:hypothetical protein
MISGCKQKTQKQISIMEANLKLTGRHWKQAGTVIGDGLRRFLLAILFLFLYHSCSGMIQSSTTGNRTTSLACLYDTEVGSTNKLNQAWHPFR